MRLKFLVVLAVLGLLFGCQEVRVCEKTKTVKWSVHHIAPGEEGQKVQVVDLEVCL